MGLQRDKIKEELKLIARGRSLHRRAELMIKGAEERLAGLIDELESEQPHDVEPAPPTPMDEERRQDALRLLRGVGYVPKIKRR